MITFQVVLGGCVVLDCEARTRFGKVDPNTVMAYHEGLPFICGGILLDHRGELVTLREYITAIANGRREAGEGASDAAETEH